MIKPALIAALALVATPALAEDASGLWIVDGHVDGKDFTVYCTFRQADDALTGVCHDNTPTGKAHALTSGSLKGDKVAFTYQSSFLITRFSAIFNGTISGATMKGQAKAAGRVGTFTGRRG